MESFTMKKNVSDTFFLYTFLLLYIFYVNFTKYNSFPASMWYVDDLYEKLLNNKNYIKHNIMLV